MPANATPNPETTSGPPAGNLADALVRWAAKCPAWAWIIPPVLLAGVVFALAVDVLHWDEWVIWGEMLHKLENGTFGLLDLAAQQNEQRNLAARLFGLALMPLFKLDRFAEYGLNILIAGASFLAAAGLYTRTGPARTTALARLLMAMFCFSVMQWETFTFGANSSVAVLPACLWIGLLTACSGPPTPLRLLAVGLIGVLPSFSFANGLFYWVAVLPCLILRAHRHGNTMFVLTAWAAMTAAAWTFYFLDFALPGHHPSLLEGLAHPLEFAGYFLAYMGGGVSSDKNLFFMAILLALLSLPLFAGLVWREWRAGGQRRENMLPWLGAALFSFCSAGVTTVARCGFGLDQALESRYASFSSPYWIALIALFLLARKAKKPGPDSLLSTTGLTLAASVAVFTLSTVLSVVVVYNRHDPFVRARKALFSLTDETALKTIFPDTAYLMMQLPLLMRDRLSIYRDVKQFADYAMSDSDAGDFTVTGQAMAAEGRIPGFTVRGKLNAHGTAILLEADGGVVGYLPEPALEWEMFVPLANFPGKTKRLRAFALDKAASSLSPLRPVGGMPVTIGELPPVDYRIEKNFFIR